MKGRERRPSSTERASGDVQQARQDDILELRVLCDVHVFIDLTAKSLSTGTGECMCCRTRHKGFLCFISRETFNRNSQLKVYHISASSIGARFSSLCTAHPESMRRFLRFAASQSCRVGYRRRPLLIDLLEKVNFTPWRSINCWKWA